LLFSADVRGRAATDSAATAQQHFCRGVIVDLLNPKIGLFFLIFLPQFVNQGIARPFWTTVGLGSMFCICGAVVNTAIALASARASRLLLTTAARGLQRWLPGTLPVIVGVRLLFQNR